MEKTLTYSPDNRILGWTTFMSFIPDYMVAMNNYFYTFKSGNLYRHNVNETRNNFYGEQFTSTIQTVINDVPSVSKLFKTISLVGDAAWEISDLSTDLQTGGYIEEAWFEEKESSFFAFIRSPQAVPATLAEYPLRSVNGIGRSSTVTGPAAATLINFSISPTIFIPSIVSVGDYLYYALPPYTTPVLAGLITDIVKDLPNGDNYIEVDCTVTGGSVPSIGTAYILTIKNQIAESSGILGKYVIVDMENSSTSKIELFMIESEIQRSFP